MPKPMCHAFIKILLAAFPTLTLAAHSILAPSFSPSFRSMSDGCFGLCYLFSLTFLIVLGIQDWDKTRMRYRQLGDQIALTAHLAAPIIALAYLSAASFKPTTNFPSTPAIAFVAIIIVVMVSGTITSLRLMDPRAIQRAKPAGVTGPDWPLITICTVILLLMVAPAILSRAFILSYH